MPYCRVDIKHICLKNSLLFYVKAFKFPLQNMLMNLLIIVCKTKCLLLCVLCRFLNRPYMSCECVVHFNTASSSVNKCFNKYIDMLPVIIVVLYIHVVVLLINSACS